MNHGVETIAKEDLLEMFHLLVGGRSSFGNNFIADTKMFGNAKIVVRKKLNNSDSFVAKRGAEFGGCSDILLTIVETRDNRNANLELCACSGKTSCVFKNRTVGNACNSFVGGVIHVFKVVKVEIGIGEGLFYGFPLGEAGGVQSSVEALFLKLFKKSDGKCGLAHSFAAGYGYTAAGKFEERLIGANLYHNLFNSVSLAADIESMGVADFSAFAAVVAESAVYVDKLNILLSYGVFALGTVFNGTLGAGLDAALLAKLCAYASHAYPAELGVECLRFGAVAPGAAKGAAL